MREYKRRFIDFALQAGVLRFGRFVLKSGRESPYFFDTGLFASGSNLARLGEHYAEAVQGWHIDADMLFGPAYKGIPLVAATAVALYVRYGRDLPYCFNRKEAKDHGEGGRTIGAKLSGRVLVVDDVVSAGTSIRESIEIITREGARPTGAVVTLDRQERGVGSGSAIQEIRHQYSIEISSIIRLDDLVEYLAERPDMAETLERMRAYRADYGAQDGPQP